MIMYLIRRTDSARVREAGFFCLAMCLSASIIWGKKKTTSAPATQPKTALKVIPTKPAPKPAPKPAAASQSAPAKPSTAPKSGSVKPAAASKSAPASKPAKPAEASKSEVPTTQSAFSITIDETDKSLKDLEALIKESIASGKKRRSHAAKQDEELKLLLAQAMFILKKKYANYPVESKFDTKIQKLFAQQAGMPIKRSTRDSIILLYVINYIQSFDFKNNDELSKVTERMFSPLLQSSKKVPAVVERLNKIPPSDKVGSVKVVAEELDKMIWETWAIQVVAALNKYQITTP